MKNKKGFTLIELLAVIVVLAIIALIATPIVMNTIKNAKKGAAERGADNYIKQVETAIATSKLDGKDIADGTYTIDQDGNLTGTGLPDGKLTIEMNGEKPKSGSIIIKNGQVDTSSTMEIGDYDISYNPTNKKYEAKPATKKYSNGEVVYFNVTTGKKCSSLDYTESQSNTGVKEECMKFYAFNDNGGDTVNLILDHNTTAMVAWISKEDYISSGYGNAKNDKGPLTALKQLKTDTDEWKGTTTPANYIMDQSTQGSTAKYIIDYSSYKARLITAQEVAQITGNTSWDEKITANSYGYYFDTNTITESTTCKSGNTTGCSYGWLYDRTYTNCTLYGCLNNSDKETYGYWTASSRASDPSGAWGVYFNASVGSHYVGNVGNVDGRGIRPVITVSKSNLN